MKLAKLLALVIALSMALLPLVPPQIHAQTGYTERIDAYVAGTDALWFIQLGGVNVSNSHVASAESTPGLNSYNLTAIKTTSWVSDFQTFGPQGYGVLPVPFVPPQGAFLTVGATSFSAASAAAAQFASYLVTSFKSTSNASDRYVFFAPISFSSVMPPTLLRLLPLGNAGFLAPITEAKFITLDSPIVTLSGQRQQGGFSHELTIGSITSSGLDSTSRPSLLNYFGQAVASLQASNKSSSSMIEFHFLDGIVTSADAATLTNDRARFSSTYTLTLKQGTKLNRVNATVIQQPAQLLATRLVDVGVLRTGSNMSVTISLTNLSNSTALSGITLSDDWWRSTGFFKLVRGSSDVSVPSLGSGQSTSPTYVLQYNGTATQQLALPGTGVSYTFSAGGATILGHTSLNTMSISLGLDEPVVYAYLSPSASLGGPVGSNQSLKVSLKNVGTRAANSVKVGGHIVGGLSADGGSATVSLYATAPSLADVNVTRSYAVSYATPEGRSLSLSTNSLSVVFSHAGMKIGFGYLALNATLSQLSGGSGFSLSLSMDFANRGTANVTSFVSRALLPTTLPCGSVSSNLTCNGRLLTLSYQSVKPSAKESASVKFNVTQPSNFIFWPASFSMLSSGYNLTGYSNAQPAPAGLSVAKKYSPSELFQGMTSQVAVSAQNAGPFVLYNATVSTGADSFDSLSGSAPTSKATQSLASGANVTFSYGVVMGAASGTTAPTAVTSSFFMGGTRFSLSTQSSGVQLNRALAASITSSPASPTEGAKFTISVKITNPATVGVTGVQLVLPIPGGISVSDVSNATIAKGGLSIALGQLAAGASYTAQATASASSGETIPFSAGKLTFSYAGQTLNGKLPPAGIAIGEDVASRYVIPTAVALLALLVVAYEARRMSRPTAPASQK
ncbi:MAG: hypothetical protein LYZ70_00335 [Nitrososphaerales archaeon]|nr:hypothetical protein [Nitrososphaerales archaeon]